MADIRQSLFQRPDDRIKSITNLNNMIANSKEVKEWDLQINLQPDEIEAKVLTRPGIIVYPTPQPLGPQVVQVPAAPSSLKSLDDTNILRQIVCQPVNFKKWAIFCLEKDIENPSLIRFTFCNANIENGKYLQDKFYSLSEQYGLNIFVDYGDIVSLHNKSQIEDFKDAINSYFKDYVQPDKKGKKGAPPVKIDPAAPAVQFFLVIIPDTLR